MLPLQCMNYASINTSFLICMNNSYKAYNNWFAIEIVNIVTIYNVFYYHKNSCNNIKLHAFNMSTCNCVEINYCKLTYMEMVNI